VIIPGRLIHKYFSSIEFPVFIYPETGDQMAYEATQAGLQKLIDADCVVAFGSWKRIKKIRLNRPEATMVKLRLKLRHQLTADCNKTVTREGVGDQGAKVWKHIASRCLAYAGGRPRKLDREAL